MPEHRYQTRLQWTGNTGTGTSHYTAYTRNHEISSPSKLAPIPGSSDPHFRGDGTRYNPEELLVASLSACHMLSYLHRCAVNGIVVTAYEDYAEGSMVETPDGGGISPASCCAPASPSPLVPTPQWPCKCTTKPPASASSPVPSASRSATSPKYALFAHATQVFQTVVNPRPAQLS